MAQDPLKPKDKGKIKLPPVDAAMNKIAPRNSSGGKGAKDDPKMLRSGETKDKTAEIVERARKRMERCISVESDNRKSALDDKKFKSGDQWPAELKARRNFEQRPCLTINKLPTFIHQVTNDLRQNRPTINVSPVGDRGDVEVAKMYRGLIRAIERESHADIAYDTAVDDAVSMGFGYCRLTTEYESETSFDQTIMVKRVRNAFSVYLDPDSQEPDGCDAKYGFICEDMPRSEFEDQYPTADPMPFKEGGIGDKLKNFGNTKDTIRIAEYYEVEEKPRTLIRLSNGHTGWEDELADSVTGQIAQGKIKIIASRVSAERTVVWYKLTALEILETEDTVWNWVPIAKFIGDEIDIEGKVTYSGVVRNSKDSQRMFNYWRTLQTEKVALAPKAKYLIEEGQIEGHESEWKNANNSNSPVLTYKGSSINSHPVPPPIRISPEGVDAAIENSVQGAAQDMMATTGIRFDATMNERMIDESGKAIRELRRSGDLGAFHYADNMARTLRHIGRMLIDAIPKVYDTKRMLTILREDDTEEQVQIDPAQQKPYAETRGQNGKTLKIFNPTYGKYGVTVTIGPSFATKRIEAADSMMDFAKAMPNVAALVADLIAKNQDWPGAQEMAARLAKALPAKFLTPEQKDVPPQVQALMEQMDAAIKQLTMERQQLVFALNEKQSDRHLAQDKINKDFEAKILGILQKAEQTLHKSAGEHAARLADGVGMLSRLLTGQDVTEHKPDVTPHLIEANTKLHQKMDEVLSTLKKPRRARLVKKSDGTTEVQADFGEDEKPKEAEKVH